MSELRGSRAVLVAAVFAAAGTAACRGCAIGRGTERETAGGPFASNLLIVTIDTLRADAVGVYGSAAARTPTLDALAADGARFDRAFAPTPITLPSHASLLTGLYPPGHGARHNGMTVRADVPTLATACRQAGFATGALVSAFPLDRRFGLARGFADYADELPRGAGGRPMNERPGSATVNDAIAWLVARGVGRVSAETDPTARATRFFLWVHLFEPHAPYGNPRDGRPARDRYADEVAESDRQIARLLEALGAAKSQTLVIATGDHGEAFGEHGEIGHSVFVYDTTLHVPLVMAGPGIPRSTFTDAVSLVDIAPTALARLGLPPIDGDGIDLIAGLRGARSPDPRSTARSSPRTIYAESFAPLLDFGWSALRSVRREGWKYIAAPRPELFDLGRDPGERTDLAREEPSRASELAAAVARISGSERPARGALNPEAERRLRSLGYLGGSSRTSGGAANRPDPKDRRALAARIARVTSGELVGDALRDELEAILAEDPSNPQAHVRLGFALTEAGNCAAAEPHFARAIALELPSTDPYLGLAGCQAERRDRHAAIRTLDASLKIEARDPVVLANLGILRSALGDHRRAVDALSQAVALDPGFLEARFNLAIAYARAGRRADAARETQALLDRLPPDAPQRAEVERLLRTVK